nr:uncharacterized protein LOC113825514 [Penaeus vannamei]
MSNECNIYPRPAVPSKSAYRWARSVGTSQMQGFRPHSFEMDLQPPAKASKTEAIWSNTPGKPTIDILVLRVTVERHREFGRGLLAVYIDLKKAFDLVHRESSSEILRLRGIPTRVIGLIASLYTGTESAVSRFFPVNSGF